MIDEREKSQFEVGQGWKEEAGDIAPLVPDIFYKQMDKLKAPIVTAMKALHEQLQQALNNPANKEKYEQLNQLKELVDYSLENHILVQRTPDQMAQNANIQEQALVSVGRQILEDLSITWSRLNTRLYATDFPNDPALRESVEVAVDLLFATMGSLQKLRNSDLEELAVTPVVE